MRKWLMVLLLLGTGYYVFTRYPVMDAFLGKLTQAQMKALIDEQNRQSNGFVERMKASADDFFNRRNGPPTKRKRAAPPPRPAPAKPPPKPPTPQELRERAEADRQERIQQMFSPAQGAVTTFSGLTYKKTHLNEQGTRPTSVDAVRVHFAVWTSDGERFESTRNGHPTILHLHRLVPGLREGILLMREGESASFWIPAKLAYGDAPTQIGAPAGPLKAHVVVEEVLNR